MPDPFVNDPDFTLYVGDALDVLRELPAESVHCCVTSPPYWGLRDYGTGTWDGGDADCDHQRPKQKDRTFYFGSGADGKNCLSWTERDGSTYLDACGKCGARRVDQQFGLEATPDEYVANMVAVFREVRRVLRADGTLWLNIGDSYASGEIGRHDGRVDGSGYGARHPGPRQQARTQTGLKPKDLVGIPWRLAFALQKPYYAGTIKDGRDRIWLAAMTDAEGCIYVHKRKVGQLNGQGYERKSDTYGSGMEISNTSRAVIERIAAITGRGSISSVDKGADGRRRQTLYRWNLRTNECRDVLREVYPHLVAKQQQARIAIGCPSSGPSAAAAHEAMKLLHAGSETTVDFAAPDSMFEPGWYLRSDCIWSKPNPMPESVTDRPTKAHEYLFLLTKSPRYFYDADAIREQAIEVGDLGVLRSKKAADGQGPTDRQSIQKRLDAGADPRNGGAHLNGQRNKRSVWEIATEAYPDAHFATFPQALVEPCVKAGCPEWVCGTCGKPRERITSAEYVKSPKHGAGSVMRGRGEGTDVNGWAGEKMPRLNKEVTTEGWSDCGHNNYHPGVVLDPFLGSGTSALVARRLGRRCVGIELNPEYARLAAQRLSQLSLFACVVDESAGLAEEAEA